MIGSQKHRPQSELISNVHSHKNQRIFQLDRTSVEDSEHTDYLSFTYPLTLSNTCEDRKYDEPCVLLHDVNCTVPEHSDELSLLVNNHTDEANSDARLVNSAPYSSNRSSASDDHVTCDVASLANKLQNVTVLSHPNVLSEWHHRTFYCREWVFEKILTFITTGSPTQNDIPVTSRNRSHGLDRSCTSLSETNNNDFSSTVQYQQGVGPQSILITGGPGSGKTTICKQMVINRFLSDDYVSHLPNFIESTQFNASFCNLVSSRVLFHHFCSTQCSLTLDPVRFVSNMKHQLLNIGTPISSLFAEELAANNCELSHHLSTESVTNLPEDAFKFGILTALQRITPKIDWDEPMSLDFEGKSINITQRLMFPFSRKFILLVDGIDECDRDNSHKMASTEDESGGPSDSSIALSDSKQYPCTSPTVLDLLKACQRYFPSWLVLLLTCRRKSRSRISHMFPGIKRISIDDLNRPAIELDMQQYLLSRMGIERDLQTSFRDHMHSDLLNLLRIKSCACMLYLETVLDAIGEGWLKPVEIALIPGTLNGLYLWLCQKLFSSESKQYETTGRFDIVRPILNVILASTTWLSETDIYNILVAADPQLSRCDFNERLWLLRNLLLSYPAFNVSSQQVSPSASFCAAFPPQTWEQTNTVHVFHPTFAEWLLDVKHCTPTYLCDISQGQSLIDFALHRGTYQLHSITETDFVLQPASVSSMVSSTSCRPCELVLNEMDDATRSLSSHDNHHVSVNMENMHPEMSLTLFDSPQHQYELFDSQLNSVVPAGNEASVEESNVEHLCLSQLDHESLVLAARKGHYGRVRALVDSGTDIDQLDEDGWSALRTASWRGQSDIVDLLLERNADVNLAGPDGRSALRAAAWAGHVDIVKRLLDAGAKVNQEDAEGRSPLIAAAYMGHIGVVEMLEQAGADLNHSDEDGRTALHVAAFCVGPSDIHNEIVSSLLEFEANPNIHDSEGMTPLLGAARAGCHAICELFLEAGTPVNQSDSSGNTSLTFAVLVLDYL